MIDYLIKSSICLLVFYSFYSLILQHQKILLFNRFYLLFSLIGSFLVPLIRIPVVSSPVSTSLNNNILSDFFLRGELIAATSSSLSIQDFLLSVFGFISIVLFIRFTFNIAGIWRKVQCGNRIESRNVTFILTPEKTLPYSFFRYIFINRDDFKNFNDEKELIRHEEAHCLQYHSIDIILTELIIVFFWFNPVVWLYRRSIQLNHEYYADNFVIEQADSAIYQKLLVKALFRNNLNILVSNFKYSFTKKRLIMINTFKPQHCAILRKISAVALFLILSVSLMLSQESKSSGKGMNTGDEWWMPILRNHNITPEAYNNFQDVFEMGSTNSINNNIVTLEDALIIMKLQEGYAFLRSPLVTHDLSTNELKTVAKTTFDIYGDSPFAGSKIEFKPPTKMKLGGVTIIVGDN